MTLVLVIWSAVLTIWCWVLSRAISALNEENEVIHFCIKNLTKAWRVHTFGTETAKGFVADEWYRDNFGDSNGK